MRPLSLAAVSAPGSGPPVRPPSHVGSGAARREAAGGHRPNILERVGGGGGQRGQWWPRPRAGTSAGLWKPPGRARRTFLREAPDLANSVPLCSRDSGAKVQSPGSV